MSKDSSLNLQVIFAVIMSLPLVSIAIPTGLGSAGGGAGGGCEGADSKVKEWCPLIKKVLSDPNTCGGKAVAELQNKQVQNADKLCPQVNSGGNKLAVYEALTAALITVESSGNPTTRGDGGKSMGLMQITPGDAYPDCPKSMNPDDPEQNIKCGTCEAFEQVKKDGQLIGEQKGLSKQYGPAREANPAHGKLTDISTKLCSAAGGAGGGSGGGGGGGFSFTPASVGGRR